MHTKTDLELLLGLINRGREELKLTPLVLDTWSGYNGKRWSLRLEYNRSLLSPACTTKEMYKILYTLDELYRPWGKGQ